ncbi:hypothetical protein AYI70_g2229, partial [Smittium culicis]|jgi:yeast amino acid transporter
MWT